MFSLLICREQGRRDPSSQRRSPWAGLAHWEGERPLLYVNEGCGSRFNASKKSVYPVVAGFAGRV